MAVRKRRRKARSYKKARRKTYKRRRRNPTRHRPVVYSYGRGKGRRLRRSPSYRLKPRRVNRYKRRRRNPKFRVPKLKTIFTQKRMMRGVGVAIGLGLGATSKVMLNNVVQNEMFSRAYGLLSIAVGATVGMAAPTNQPLLKGMGAGLVAYGILDLIITNVPTLAQYLPAIAGPTAFLPTGPAEAVNGMGAYSYGRSMMGASLQPGVAPEIVGANISQNMEPEIVGDDYDLADVLEAAI